MSRKIAIASVSNEGIVIVVNLEDENFLAHLESGIKISKWSNRNTEFDQGIIYRIPYSDNTISAYHLSSTYERRFNRDNDIVDPNGIEYLALRDDKRCSFANENNLNPDWKIFYSREEMYYNLSKNGEKGAILIEGDGINIECNKDYSQNPTLSQSLRLSDFVRNPIPQSPKPAILNESRIIYDKLPIELVPSDVKECKRLFIEKESAIKCFYFEDGRIVENLWKLKNFSETSDLLANLRGITQARKNFWKEKGIVKLVVKFD